MSLNVELIKQKINQLQNRLHQLNSMEFSLQELQITTDIQDLLSFRLQQSVELAIDITMHLIANLDQLQFKDQAKEAFDQLSQAKIISPKTANQMALATGFRNLIVHQYDDIDFKQLFKDYGQDIKSLQKFSQEILKFLNTIN